MKDEIVRVKVGRRDKVIGSFFLSFAELFLKKGRFHSDDWGWIDGMPDWKPLCIVLEHARNQAGIKRLATTGQRNYLRKKGFQPWEGISNREASAIIESSWEAKKAPSGWWIGDPISEEQISFLTDIGIEYHQLKATAKQIAYLEFMGIDYARDLDAFAACDLIDNLFKEGSHAELIALERRQRDWQLERYVLHPEIYANELSSHLERIELERSEILHNYVRSMISQGSEKLTKKKIRAVMNYLHIDSPNWWQEASYQEVFFKRLSEIHPGCVDGVRKS